MGLIVQKYGGSSLATLKHIRGVAQRISETALKGHEVVVVASARGKRTEQLTQRALQLNAQASRRELDMLLHSGEQESIALLTIALQALGHSAVSCLGFQAGVLTDQQHSQARIVAIRSQQLEKRIEEGRIVVVAGFQGHTEEGELTTLGKDGSDLTAIALAVSLGAKQCEIYTDVNGVCTANPLLVPQAHTIAELSHEEMIEMAASGSSVLQVRSLQLAEKHRLQILTRNSFNQKTGTTIHTSDTMETPTVRSINLDTQQGQINLLNLPEQAVAEIFEGLSRHEISVDLIIQQSNQTGHLNLSFTLETKQLTLAKNWLEKKLADFPEKVTLRTFENITKLSLVGKGMRNESGIAATFFRILAKHHIEPKLISSSEIKILAMMDKNQAPLAAQALHEAFQL